MRIRDYILISIIAICFIIAVIKIIKSIIRGGYCSCASCGLKTKNSSKKVKCGHNCDDCLHCKGNAK